MMCICKKAVWFFPMYFAAQILVSFLPGMGLAESQEAFAKPKLIYHQFAYVITGERTNENRQKTLHIEALNMETNEQFALSITDYGMRGNGQSYGGIQLGSNAYAYEWDNEYEQVKSINYPGGITFSGETYAYALETNSGRMIVPQDMPANVVDVRLLRGAVHLVEDFKWKPKGGLIVAGLALCAYGLWCALAPRSVWYIGSGWRLKDVEPSDLTLSLNRLIGWFSVFAGVFLFFLGIKG